MIVKIKRCKWLEYIFFSFKVCISYTLLSIFAVLTK
nr:MAG TPA: hypothetical protein [Caudoviricetes sp.]DAX80224.1 MAG TPA: hypothetical protein [Bacteriophage sp.]